jgi:hypothetical protein
MPGWLVVVLVVVGVLFLLIVIDGWLRGVSDD